MKTLDPIASISLNTIPVFPKFKKLEIADDDSIKYFTNRFQPYSDYNFVSMWSWNTTEQVEISQLNNNLIVKFSDYLTSEPFFSFIGNQEVDDTVEKLLKFAKRENIQPKLKLVPVEVMLTANPKKFSIADDSDNYDYILSNEKLVDYKGKILRGHASFRRRFIETYGDGVETRILDISDREVRDQILSMNERWISNKVTEQKNIYPEIEFEALKRLFKVNRAESPFVLVGIFYKNKMIGFTLDELLNHGFTIRHFMKADVAYKGVYSYMLAETAGILLKMGMRFTNIEQDLGLMNLRQSKKTYDPVAFLKKQVITYKQ